MFLAVDPAPDAVAELDRALQPLRQAPGAPRWSPLDRWHLTLLFLDQVPGVRLTPLLDAVGPAVGAAPPMSLAMAEGGRFGSRRRPTVCWVGVTGDVAPLTALADRLATAARGVGLPVEDRPFRPHLTVGRWRRGQPADGDLPDRLQGHRGPSWPVTEVVLCRSHLGPVPRYERVTAWPVG
ncbi:RNA 2',3'-cyclic phosphodiesterase [Modestobacter roseus]|uniref:RNA 2',3'-cyclic phosphodiesterase n=1 Tax=Modestobacter roseus TaxID=1181884 RepID=UPI001E4C7048|nr:RNA 2',3'-cyclic phosphodiesterase [Modestobacter roseus]